MSGTETKEMANPWAAAALTQSTMGELVGSLEK